MQPHSLLVRVTAALCGTMLLASSALVAVRYGTGAFAGGYHLTATFDRSSQGLDDQSSVKLRGVNVGAVKSIRLRPDGRADVTLHIDPGAHIARTTTASIEPLSVFGPAFVNLHPGADETTGPFLTNGDHLVATTSPIEFTDVLDRVDTVLNAVDPNDVSTILHTFADSVAGLGPALRRTLDNTSTLVDIAAQHLPQAEQLLADLHLLSSSLVAHADSISATITNTASFLPVVADRTDEIDHLLTGSSEIASSLAGYLQQHAQSAGTFISSAASVLGVAAAQVAKFPDLFRLIDEFFGRVGDALRLPGPGGVLIGALHGGLVSSVCANFHLPLTVPCGLVGP
jgi:phospholipid/cholesterol/gamma-HCH transport system substrate-binding protein